MITLGLFLALSFLQPEPLMGAGTNKDIRIMDSLADLDIQTLIAPIGVELRLPLDYPLLRIKMPCGQVYKLFLGDRLPTNSIPCTCGNTNHWFIKIDTTTVTNATGAVLDIDMTK